MAVTAKNKLILNKKKNYNLHLNLSCWMAKETQGPVTAELRLFHYSTLYLCFISSHLFHSSCIFLHVPCASESNLQLCRWASVHQHVSCYPDDTAMRG